MEDRMVFGESMDIFCETVERWNEEEEYSLCIKTLEALPEEKRDYRVVYLLARAYQNLVMYGDHGSGTSEDTEEIEACMEKALELLDSVWEEGIDRADWNELAAYSYLCLEEYRLSVRHAKRWLKLDPDNKEAESVLEVIEERWRAALEEEEESEGESEEEANESEEEEENEDEEEYENEQENDEEKDEYFGGTILLPRNKIDIEKFIKLMEQFWEQKAKNLRIDENGNFIVEFNGRLVLLSLSTDRCTPEQLQEAAEHNFMWPEAAEEARRCRAFIAILTSGSREEAYETKALLLKMLFVFCRMYDVIAVHLNSVLYEPDYFIRHANDLFRGITPVPLMVWIGMHTYEGECFLFTAGLDKFGMNEIEMLPTRSDPDEVYQFLTELTREILEGRLVMRAEQVAGPPDGPKFMVSCSDGIVHDGKTFKMKYW